jgi:uncharacterized iron-regulated membrane protein
MNRPFLARLHRYAGLSTAAFLLFSGLTGAVISWDHEIDEWLNPHLTKVKGSSSASSNGPDPLTLAEQIEARHPQVQVTFLPLAAEPGHSLVIGVEGRVDPATGRLFEPGFNQIFIDPDSGAELGRREWGAAWPVTRETVVSFLYKLHYSLHMPELWGTDQWGVWLLGAVAMVWTLDCFVGFWLTLPSRRAVRRTQQTQRTQRTWWTLWKPSWRLRTRAGAYKLNFDLHRATSLWTWGLLLTLAFSAFSLNLYREIFFPVMRLVSDVTPSPMDLRTPADVHQPIAPAIGYREIVARAAQAAKDRDWQEPVGSVFYAREYGVYDVSFHRPEDAHGVGGVGFRTLYFDGQDGRVLGKREPWKGTAADIFVQAQFPVHSGRILGVPGRILISIMGVVVAMLSVTGVVIWLRKRRAQIRAATLSELNHGRATLEHP